MRSALIALASCRIRNSCLLPMLLPGIRLKTSPTDLGPIKQMRLAGFDGERCVLFSDVLASE